MVVLPSVDAGPAPARRIAGLDRCTWSQKTGHFSVPGPVSMPRTSVKSERCRVGRPVAPRRDGGRNGSGPIDSPGWCRRRAVNAVTTGLAHGRQVMGTRRAKRAGFALCLCLVAMGLAAQPSWADDAFAKITGSIQGVILGDQPDVKGIAGSKDAVQVFSTAFGLAVPVSTSTSGGGATLGKPQAGPLAVVKRFDRASPKLLRAAFT